MADSNTVDPSLAASEWVQAAEGWLFHTPSALYFSTQTNAWYGFNDATQQYELVATPQESAAQQDPPLVRLTADARFMQGRRPKQEDRHVLIGDLRTFCQDNQLAEALANSGLTMNPGALYCLFDGHCGTLASEFCAKELPLRIMKELLKTDTPSKPSHPAPSDSASAPPPANTDASNGTPVAPSAATSDSDEISQDRRIHESFRRAFHSTDVAFLQKYRLNRDGCTAVLTLVLGNKVYVAFVGDSRAVAGRKNDEGKMVAERLTEDHKPNRPDERTRIEKAGGRIFKAGGVYRVANSDYEARVKRIKLSTCQYGGATEKQPIALAVSRAFGDKELKDEGLVIVTPEICTVPLDARHRVIFMACDGVWDVLSDQAVIDMVSEHDGNPKEAASAVVMKAYQKGSEDNLTAVTIFLDDIQPSQEAAAKQISGDGRQVTQQVSEEQPQPSSTS
ncbi:unnamed protein product [Vitrella brassicaformis CCMP3155]|uniref:PPM-type phosphatase domain-containing protein n=1 Tax=Vitrella brassicaformis (strain CCMP3155) TaxID=1169540 RepID=A0A0G4ELB8_VITBC|nr:unnamed protein product [Vitrella brassicaformis CCMP3155]|eukprot:CEL97486.1 unnamed protein product [Vitrella brassicaformis CCMP3155]